MSHFLLDFKLFVPFNVCGYTFLKDYFKNSIKFLLIFKIHRVGTHFLKKLKTFFQKFEVLKGLKAVRGCRTNVIDFYLILIKVLSLVNHNFKIKCTGPSALHFDAIVIF